MKRESTDSKIVGIVGACMECDVHIRHLLFEALGSRDRVMQGQTHGDPEL